MDRKKYALVVDDEPRILHFVRAQLNLAGYNVITTTSGEEALQLLKSKNPNIMLLDFLMTPMSSFEVLTQLRAFSKLPVIVFTGRSDIASTVLSAEADDYLDKPFKPEELIKKIKNLLEKPESLGEQVPSCRGNENKKARISYFIRRPRSVCVTPV